MRDSGVGLRADLDFAEKGDHNLTGSDCVQGEIAPDHCPVCLSPLRTYRTKRLADDGNRRYRRCPEGCYRDRAVMIVERSTLNAPD